MARDWMGREDGGGGGGGGNGRRWWVRVLGCCLAVERGTGKMNEWTGQWREPGTGLPVHCTKPGYPGVLRGPACGHGFLAGTSTARHGTEINLPRRAFGLHGLKPIL